MRTFGAILPTELAGDDGQLCATKRKTTVDLSAANGQKAMIYEMGIPVVETEIPWNVDVQQKVPLTLDRINVLPSFLRKLKVACFNETADMLDKETASQSWVKEASGDAEADSNAVSKAIKTLYGEKVVAYDRSDPEANSRAVAEGFVVLHGGSLSKGQWAKVREAGAAPAAGKVCPTPAVERQAGLFGGLEVAKDKLIAEDKLNDNMRNVRALAKRMAVRFLGHDIDVYFVNDAPKPFLAWYGCRELTFNTFRTRVPFYEPRNLEAIVDLIVHELGHDVCGNHLDDRYHRAITKMAGQCVTAAMDDPTFFALSREG